MKRPFLINVLLAGHCNFDCFYCYIDRNERRKEGFGRLATSEGVRDLLEIADELGTCEISLCGTGEASLLPNFFELCEAITKRHYLTIITNFSFSDDEFIRTAPSERVFEILVSLHPEHEKDIGSFFKRIGRYLDEGYSISITYVAHPLRIKNIPGLHERSDSMGVSFRLVPFYGTYDGKNYPAGYTKKERELLFPYITSPSAYHGLVHGPRLHKGKPCNAAHTSFHLDDRSGDIFRCQTSNTLLGNLDKGKINVWDRAYPCDDYVCRCAEHAEEERRTEEYYKRTLTEKGTPKVFTAKDAEWYLPLCEPIREEYKDAMHLLPNERQG